MYAAFSIFKKLTSVLVNQAIIYEDLSRNIISNFDEVKDVHEIRNRASLNDVHIEPYSNDHKDIYKSGV